MGKMGSSMRSDRKPGSAAGAGAGTGVVAGFCTGAAACVDGVAGAEASAAGALAVAVGADAGAGADTSGAVGAAGITGAMATAGTSMAALGGLLAVLAGTGATPPAGLAAVPSLFKSVMFFDSSAMRVAASLVCLSLTTSSSAVFWPFTEPLDRVSLSGAAVAGFFSSTCVCTVPAAERCAAATCVAGATPASLRRNSLKSRACAVSIWRACGAGVACAAA